MNIYILYIYKMANNIIDFLENTDIPDMIKILKANNILQNNNIVKHKYQHGGNYLYYNIPGNNIDSWQNMNISPWYNTPWQNQYYNIEDEKNTIIFLANIYKALKEANDKKQDSKDTTTAATATATATATTNIDLAKRTDAPKWAIAMWKATENIDPLVDSLSGYGKLQNTLLEKFINEEETYNAITEILIPAITEVIPIIWTNREFSENIRILNSQNVDNKFTYYIVLHIIGNLFLSRRSMTIPSPLPAYNESISVKDNIYNIMIPLLKDNVTARDGSETDEFLIQIIENINEDNLVDGALPKIEFPVGF